MKDIFKINFNTDRIYGLDILRCLAIVFVVLTHGNLYLSKEISGLLNYIIIDGVGIFFVLSGFLIGSIFIKSFGEQTISGKALLNFWKRRWFRTLPNYFLILLLLIILGGLIKDNWNYFYTWRFFVFSQNLFSEHPVFFSEAWSLSVEEWFYLSIPILIYGCCKFLNLNTRKSILYVSILVIISVTLFRYLRFSNIEINSFHDWDMNFRKQVFTRLDAIMIGLIGAYISRYHKLIWEKYRKLLFFAGILMLYHRKFIPLEYNSLYVCVFSFSTSAIGALFTIPMLSNMKNGNGFIYKVVTYISIISYSMYLLNYSLVREIIIGYPTDGYEVWRGITDYFSFWSLTIALSILLYKFYEKPMTNLRDINFKIKLKKAFRNMNTT